MNMRLLKIVGLVALGFLLALGSGWIWGSLGRWTAERQLADVTLRLRLTDVRSRILGARVDLYNLNFGAAARNLDAARGELVPALQAIEAADASDPRAERLHAAVADLDTATKWAGTMRQDAHVPADKALQAVSAAARPGH